VLFSLRSYAVPGVLPYPRVMIGPNLEWLHDTLLSDTLRKFLEPACEVVGIARNGRELLEAAPKVRPDVIVLDLSMPELGGLEAGSKVRALLPGVKVIYLTMNEDPDIAAEALRQGAFGYVVKSAGSLRPGPGAGEGEGRWHVRPVAGRGKRGASSTTSSADRRPPLSVPPACQR